MAVSTSLEIIDELRTEGAVNEDFSHEPIGYLIETYDFRQL